MNYDVATPKPSALIESLRSVGYSLATAIADIVDNSIAAKAKNVWIDFHWDGAASQISILDDGVGMNEAKLLQAMRPGSFSPSDERRADDLGRFGLGLKTASFSQARELHVWSKEKGGNTYGRCWDLDYVKKHDDWRLRKDLEIPNTFLADIFAKSICGTLVVWRTLDRLVDADTLTSNATAHRFFFQAVKDVRQHLAMVFHRYVSSELGPKRRINIFINGQDSTAKVLPWHPFEGSGKTKAQPTPVEVLEYQGGKVHVRGWVLPHKDKLTADEFSQMAGPGGWTAQQGFYIYRNDRILVAGDWLHLGRERLWPKDEHHKLARLSIDIPNSMDSDWDLDVKKSAARPPTSLRPRLTDLAESVRNDARRIFAHRGVYNQRRPSDVVLHHPWKSDVRGGHNIYQANREHPLIAGVRVRLGPLAAQLDSVLRLLEENVPVERIWLDKAESERDNALPYEGISIEVLRADIRDTLQYLLKRGQSRNMSEAILRAAAPFDRFPELVAEILELEP